MIINNIGRRFLSFLPDFRINIVGAGGRRDQVNGVNATILNQMINLFPHIPRNTIIAEMRNQQSIDGLVQRLTGF